LTAIEQRNPEMAFRLMTDHLTDAGNLLLQGRAQANAKNLRDHLASAAPVHKALRPVGKALRSPQVLTTAKSTRSKQVNVV